MDIRKQSIYPVEVWDITETEFKKELWKKRMHSILIQDWKEILSMDFMKVKKSVMGRRTLGLRYGVSPF